MRGWVKERGEIEGEEEAGDDEDTAVATGGGGRRADEAEEESGRRVRCLTTLGIGMVDAVVDVTFRLCFVRFHCLPLAPIGCRWKIFAMILLADLRETGRSVKGWCLGKPTNA